MKTWGSAAAAWCALFAALHVYWALGGSAGLAESAGADLAAHRPAWFVLGGLWGVAAVLLVGAWICLDLTQRWRRLLALLGGAVLLGRGLVVEIALLTTDLPHQVGERQTRWSLWLWNPWFVLGGVLVLAAYLSTRSKLSGTGGGSASVPARNASSR
ncbi:DUF3995 domain-containing protein [Lentzea terrae]|uniref:DUF3995 domain-containing protein n=1 Tax=Lentzea terrae TaxID=2200761 RepID=UPI000DD2EBF6|nr:DUF3995 domain-containing protein [Lentzea terrae]